MWAASGSSAQVFNLSLSVDEGLPPDTLVGDIRAGLPAAQQQEVGGFFLSEDSDDSPLLDDFHVHPDTGIIRTARSLDRERRDHYSFVAATLLGAVVQVEIHVNDVNDHSPRFPRDSLRLDVSELSPPGTAFRLPGAHDPDAGLFSTQGYTLVPPPDLSEDPAGPFFQLRYGAPGSPPSPLSSSPLEPLDLAWHQLVVEARDGGAEPEVATVRVSIAVLDVNDNRPAIHLLFLTEGGAARVSEGARPGDYVARVSVSDADGDPEKEGEAAGGLDLSLGDRTISLTLEGAEGAFTLKPGGSPGVFFLCVQGPLDRESRDLYNLRLVATDAGSPPLSTEETLLLRIADLNDQPPLFSQEHYQASVSEAAAPGTAVLWVSASDADEAGTGHAKLHYELVHLPERCSPEAQRPRAECAPSFTINPETGLISTTRSLDREVQEAVELRVVAQDLGEPPLSATCLVSITVNDVNDNEPIFWRQVYNATLVEHAQVGHCFLQVSVSGLWVRGEGMERL
ncbi:Protein dachsous [Myotis davidii]|uniref:Protein dachsous n=1 Tax=Myotis davidii TaxID=225400 RepID=L5LG82_MYODS|nr:Protein dachsous [Myotis davidii]